MLGHSGAAPHSSVIFSFGDLHGPWKSELSRVEMMTSWGQMEKPEMARFNSMFSRSQILTQCISSFIHPFVAFWPRPSLFPEEFSSGSAPAMETKNCEAADHSARVETPNGRASPKQGRSSRQSGVKRSFYWRVLGKDM